MFGGVCVCSMTYKTTNYRRVRVMGINILRAGVNTVQIQSRDKETESRGSAKRAQYHAHLGTANVYNELPTNQQI